MSWNEASTWKLSQEANAMFPPARPQGLWLLGAHPPDPLPEGLAPLDSPDGICDGHIVSKKATRTFSNPPCP